MKRPASIKLAPGAQRYAGDEMHVEPALVMSLLPAVVIAAVFLPVRRNGRPHRKTAMAERDTLDETDSIYRHGGVKPPDRSERLNHGRLKQWMGRRRNFLSGQSPEKVAWFHGPLAEWVYGPSDPPPPRKHPMILGGIAARPLPFPPPHRSEAAFPWHRADFPTPAQVIAKGAPCLSL